MIPYNPSSFDRNKTILEQILELQKWLKEHPSYKVYSTYVHYYPAQNRDIWFNEINGDTDFIDSIAIGDIVVWGDGYFSSVEAVSIDPDDRDNSYVTMALPVTSLIGPQGPAGTNGVSVTSATVDSAGYLRLSMSDGSTIVAGMVKGADGTNGTNGVDGAYVSTATVDGNGDLQITIYDPATSTSSTINAGHVVGPAGQGMQVINTTTSTGTLSASDLAKANGTDDCIVIFTDNGADLTMQRILKDSSNVYFYAHFVDTGKASFLLCEVNAVTGAYNIAGGDLPIKDSNINSGSATAGQVLTADGSNGASWQTPSGGLDVVNISSSSGTLSVDDYNKLVNGAIVKYTYSYSNYFLKAVMTNSYNLYLENIMAQDNPSDYFKMILSHNDRTYTITKLNLPIRSANIDSESATNGQVLTADGNGSASWQNASGSQLYQHNISIWSSNWNYRVNFAIYTTDSSSYTISNVGQKCYDIIGTKHIVASGSAYTNSINYTIDSVSATNNTTITFYYKVDTNGSTGTISWSTGNDFRDDVIQIM